MEQIARLSELVAANPGVSATELRDALRLDGRVSITTADVLRTLTGDARTFVNGPPNGTGWWPAGAAPPTWPAPSLASRRSSFTLSPPYDVAFGEASRLPRLYRWQREALAAWREAGCCGVVEAVTGTGKTMVGLTAACEELARGGQVLVIVPTRELLVQWHRALSLVTPTGVSIGLLGMGHDAGLGHHDAVIAVVNSARDGDLSPRRPGGLLIGDECHRYASNENRRALLGGFPHRLGLSATFARPDDGHLDWLVPYFGMTCYRLGYDRARRDDVIAPFDVTLVALDFLPVERAMYDEYDAAMSVAAGELVARFGLPTEPAGAFLAAVSALARTDGRGGFVARLYLQAMRDRRQVLDEAASKSDLLLALGPAVGQAERTLVFTSSIDAADRSATLLLDLGHSAASIHSGHSSHDRRVAMDSFRDGRLKVLVAPQVLDEGVDVPSADLAIVLGATRSRRQMVQRMGRVVRRKADGRRARFVVGYIERTVEDPARGAHEAFLDEVVTVARRLTTYTPATDGWADLVELLAPFPIAI